MQAQQQIPQMAGMNANMNGAGPLNGTPMMGSLQRPGMPMQHQQQQQQQQQQPQRSPDDSRAQLNTYIYDYFIRNKHHSLAAKMLESNLEVRTKKRENGSPSGRNVNGVDAMKTELDDLPEPVISEHAPAVQNSFLMDWWESFWDVFAAARNQPVVNAQSKQYIQHTRNVARMHNDERTNRMLMANNAMGAQYNMMRGMPNGVAGNANDMKRAAAMNNRPNGPNNNAMANMQMKSQQIMAAQMQRDGSQMDMNGQRPHSPGSNENAPSPNKRPRVEGGMNAGNMPGNSFNDFAAQGGNLQQQKSIEVYAQSLAQQQRLAMPNQAMPQGMNTGVQGSPMNQQGLEGQHEVYTGNQPRPGMPAPGPGQQQGNHALQDYQMQLMLLEQQNKKRLLMARQEQDNISTAPHGQAIVGPPGFAPAMSPQGSRSGPSPNPNDQMKRGTPKLNQPGLPGSPMPDASMQQRSSPAPGGFPIDPSQMPPGMPPQFGYPQMGQTPMMRPPSSHPGGFNPQMTQQQMEAIQRNGGMPNGGGWRGPPQGMMPGQGQPMGGPMGNPQRGGMPPPPAPVGEQPRAQEPSPSQSTAAPPTPSQTNKANPKKKQTKDNKKPAKAKGATGSTPAAPNEEPPTPATPITPIHAQSFQNGKQQPSQPAQPPPPAAPSQQSVMDNGNGPFGNIGDETNFDISTFALTDDAGGLGDFDFDSFLHVNEDAGFGSLGDDFNFGAVEAGGEV